MAGVGSLLEVGTGFHGELTGRENVYLNGAILGMRRAEIDRRFDEIVAFAEVARFLDTPVKRYSIGMTVRLAFAVAAHLEPEILLVDEVLAVGDAGFQRKCIGKMSEVAGEGRTVLFVSHNMAIMQSLCRRGIFLEHGSVHTDGSIVEAVTTYLRASRGGNDRPGAAHRPARLARGRALDPGDKRRRRHHDARDRSPGPVCIPDDGREADAAGRLSCSFTILNNLGQPVATLASDDRAPNDVESAGDDHSFVCDIDASRSFPDATASTSRSTAAPTSRTRSRVLECSTSSKGHSRAADSGWPPGGRRGPASMDRAVPRLTTVQVLAPPPAHPVEPGTFPRSRWSSLATRRRTPSAKRLALRWRRPAPRTR